MVGVISILIHWVALNHFGQNLSPPRSHWSLLADLQQLPEEELEDFLHVHSLFFANFETSLEFHFFFSFTKVTLPSLPEHI